MENGSGKSSVAQIQELRNGAAINGGARGAGRAAAKSPGRGGSGIGEGSKEQIMDVISSPGFRSQLEKLIPKGSGLTVERLINAAERSFDSQRLLRCCDAGSFSVALKACAELGLAPGPMGHVYLVANPIQRSTTVGYEASMVIGYKGLIALAMRAGRIKEVKSNIVTENEIKDEKRFALYYEGREDTFIHNPIIWGDRGAPVAAWGQIRMADGSWRVEVVRKDQMEVMKQRSMAKFTGNQDECPWVRDEEDMWQAAAIRRVLRCVDLEGDAIERVLMMDDRRVEVPTMGWEQMGQSPAGSEGVEGGTSLAALEGADSAGAGDPDDPGAGQNVTISKH